MSEVTNLFARFSDYKMAQQAVIALLERDQPSIRSDVKAGRLVLAEYRESASAQLEFWRARMRAALKHGLSRAHVVGDVSAGALGRLPALGRPQSARYRRLPDQVSHLWFASKMGSKTTSETDCSAISYSRDWLARTQSASCCC